MKTAIKPISTDAMMAELSITFPALWKRPLREFGWRYAHTAGVWTGSGDDGNVMPDGAPIFDSMANGGDDSDYDGTVHKGFLAWFDARGWYVENYDGATYHLVPDFPWKPIRGKAE